MNSKNIKAIKIVLLLAGIFIMFSGLNIGLGGIRTLGWGGQKNFVEVTNMNAFLIQDSHVRFVGAVWLGVGLFFILALTNLEKYKHQLYLTFVLIFLGGVMRLFQLHLEVTFGPYVVGSFIAEIVGMPLLYLWISRTLK